MAGQAAGRFPLRAEWRVLLLSPGDVSHSQRHTDPSSQLFLPAAMSELSRA